MSDVTDTQAELNEAQAVFEAAQEAVAEAQRVFLEAQAKRDEAILAAQGPVNPHQDQIDRMAYINAQAQQRAARFGVAFELRENAPSPDALDPRSPIDKSMQRKTARGHARPKVGVKE